MIIKKKLIHLLINWLSFMILVVNRRNELIKLDLNWPKIRRNRTNERIINTFKYDNLIFI